MAVLSTGNRQEPPLLRLEPFRGIDLSATPTQIEQNKSPDMLNMHIDERGALNKRTGYKRIFSKSLGDGPINGIFHFQKTDGTEQLLFAHGNKLYKTDKVPDRTRIMHKWDDDILTETWESEVF